jgi:hypothetical protein
LILLAIKIGFVDRDGIDQRRHFGWLRGEPAEVGLDAVDAQPLHAIGDAAGDVVMARVVEGHAGPQIQELADAP